MRALGVPVVLAGVGFLALLGALGAARASASTVLCRSITARLAGNDFSYRIRVERGRIACTSARAVIRSFIVTARSPRGWACFRGHGSTRWGAACAGTAGLTRGVVVRAYLIAG
jgi:hypothetical protein